MLGATTTMHQFENKDFQSSYLGVDDVDDDWLAPLSNGLQATQLNVDQSCDIRRVNSTPAMHYAAADDSAAAIGCWGGSTAPLPIRPMRRMMNPEDYSSLESSQSLLNTGHGSYTDDNAFLQRYPGAGSHGAMLHRHGSFAGTGTAPRSMPAAYSAYPHSHSMPVQTYSVDIPPFVPQDPLAAVEFAIPPPVAGSAGHWAWIPATAPAPSPMAVPIATGPVPLPVSMNTFDSDMDLELLDSIDILEMADTLAPEASAPRGRIPKRAVGSCPLPALLEDSLSADNDGSDDTMQRAITDSPSLERFPSGTITSGSYKTGSARSSHHGIPIPARTAPLKVQRPSRSLSSPHLATMLGSSCPVSGADRPLRNAARRSLAVTAAALHDVEEDTSDSEASEEPLPSSYHSGMTSNTLRRASSHGGSASNLKKKHNPWSMEETMALVEGVRMAGVGKWAEIKRLTVPDICCLLDTRSAVDLKDKWRNLTRVARLPKAALRARLQRGPSDIPLETMLAVKQLMDASQDE